MTKKRYVTLDSFRGLCACLVALSHFNANSLLSNTPLLDRGAIYVDFFFVLSGFVIFANYGDKLRSGYSIGKFILLRFGRLYPLHFCVLMAFIGIDLLQMVLPLGGLAIYKPFSAPGEGFGNIVANLLLVHSLGVSKHLAFNGPSWSISVEFYTYILFALILAFGGRHSKTIIAIAGMASAMALYVLAGELYAKQDYGFLRGVYGFACGALVYELYGAAHLKFQPVVQNRKLANAIEVALFAATIIYMRFFSYGALSMAAPLVFSAVVLLFAFEGGAVSDILKLRPLVFLGLLSYSIYMNHMFISGKFFAFPVRMLESRAGLHLTVQRDGLSMYGTSLLAGTLMEIFYMLVVVGCSYISYRIIEEPCRNWTRQFVNGEAGFKYLKVTKAQNIET